MIMLIFIIEIELFNQTFSIIGVWLVGKEEEVTDFPDLESEFFDIALLSSSALIFNTLQASLRKNPL